MGKVFIIGRSEGEQKKVLIWKGMRDVFYPDIPDENSKSSICLL